MSQFYDDIVAADVVYFWFAANETTGTGGDGATPLFDVRLGGAAAGAAPTASGTPTLLTHADYLPGSYEIAIDTTGYANGHYGVFCSLTISTVNPGGFVGSFRVRTANRIDAIKAKTDNLPSDPADASVIAGRFDTLDTSVGDIPDNAEFAAALAASDDATLAAIAALDVAAIKAKTDQLTFTATNMVDANIQAVNDVVLVGDGSGMPWGPA